MVGHQLGNSQCQLSPQLCRHPSMDNAVTRNLERLNPLHQHSLPSQLHLYYFPQQPGNERLATAEDKSSWRTCAYLWVSISSTYTGLGHPPEPSQGW